MGIKRDKLDDVYSRLVRLRADWRCESTGQDHQTAALECCHVVGRRNRAVRWHPLNAMCLTHAEHRRFTENPLAFIDFVQSKIGQQSYDELRVIANTPLHLTAPQREGLYQHYLTEFARLESARQNGRMGRIEFFWPSPIPEVRPRGEKAKLAKKAKVKRAKIAQRGFQTTLRRKISGAVVPRDGKAKLA